MTKLIKPPLHPAEREVTFKSESMLCNEKVAKRTWFIHTDSKDFIRIHRVYSLGTTVALSLIAS